MCVAVCCSVLQCVAVCCNVLQHVAVCCSMLQCVVVCCRVLQCVAVAGKVCYDSHLCWIRMSQERWLCCSVSVFQCDAV